jgi:uncharacterized protein YndB with AHSA1/START domain
MIWEMEYLTKINLLEEPKEHEIIIDRVFDAPIELVWNAWTKVEQITKWFNSAGLDIDVIEFDVRPNGHFRFKIPNPDSNKILGEYTGTYVKVQSPDELSFNVKDFSINKNPNGISASFKALFEFVGKQTLLRLIITLEDESYREITVTGWNQSFENLASYLGNKIV